MSNVFISYARSTEEQARQVESALRNRGYEVWRDDELPAHRAYAEVIEERLKSAKAVVVLWSADAAKSQWVRAEADAGRELGTLVQASVDGTTPPMPFNQIQCADLNGWDGGEEDAGWRKVKSSVEALAGAPIEAAQPAKQRRQKKSVCVLPFANMSGDAEQEYFSDGISEDITTDLSKVSALAVTARNTAFMFRGQSVDVAEIARKLGVSHVLEGSVRKAGNRVRITAQLIDGATGDHVWADRWDRDLDDIFAIQDEISKAIVEALKLKLLPEEKKAIEHRGTTSAEAYNLYLKARQYTVSGNVGNARREETIERICRQAVALDPDYARAWGLMALAQANLRVRFGRSGDGGAAAAERALSLDPRIAEAHCARAETLAFEGNIEEANAEIETALALDPDSWEANKEAGRIAMLQRRFPEATLYYEKALSLMEDDFHSVGPLVCCYQEGGDRERVQRTARMGVERGKKALDEDPTNGFALGMVGAGLAVLGEKEQAKEWIDRAVLIDPDNDNMRYNFACVLARHVGDTDAALDMLEPAFATGRDLVKLADADPDFDEIRDHPRFKKMMADARQRLATESSAASSPAF